MIVPPRDTRTQLRTILTILQILGNIKVSDDGKYENKYLFTLELRQVIIFPNHPQIGSSRSPGAHPLSPLNWLSVTSINLVLLSFNPPMRNLQILWDYPILTTQQSPINAPPLSLPKQLLSLPDLHQINIRFKSLRDGLGFLERKSKVCDAETTQPPSTLVVCLHSYCVVEDAVTFRNGVWREQLMEYSRLLSLTPLSSISRWL